MDAFWVQKNPFMYEMVYAVRDDMQVAYPDLIESCERESQKLS